MSKLYDDVKKQEVQIDDLQKTVTNHTTRIETLETKAKATPPQAPVNIPTPKVTVTVPDNIATKENIVGVVNKALHLMTDYVAEVVTKLYTENPPQRSPNPASEISDEQIEKIAQKAADKAVNKRYEKLDAIADTAMHRIYNLVNGAVWAAIPKWAYIIFAIAVLAAGGFGYGFFYQLNENSKLKDVEWLYRYERGLNRDMNVVMHRERLILHGNPHEVDSMKSLIRHHEQRTQADTTFVNYYPSNPKSRSMPLTTSAAVSGIFSFQLPQTLLAYSMLSIVMTMKFINFAFKFNFMLMTDLNRIKVILVEKKRTNKWLAEELGKDPATVSKWCTNTSQPDIYTFAKIADLLEVDIRDLLISTKKS